MTVGPGRIGSNDLGVRRQSHHDLREVPSFPLWSYGFTYPSIAHRLLYSPKLWTGGFRKT
jgi:hypothetical protein